jgi:superfamily II DNA or RNA helicase
MDENMNREEWEFLRQSDHTKLPPKSKPKNGVPDRQPYQDKAIQKAIDNDGSILLCHPMGSGKTRTSVDIVEALRDRGKASIALAVVPASLRTNFVDHGINKYTKRSSTILGSITEDRPDIYDKRIPKADYYVVSYDMFKKDPYEYLDRLKPDTLIVDEMHNFREETTKNYEAMRLARKSVKNFIGLTGTPFNNHPSDVVPLLNIVSNGIADLGKNKKDFKSKFLFKTEEGNEQLRNKTQISNELNKWISYVDMSKQKTDDVLPEKVIQEIDVEMSPKQKQHYRFAMSKLSPDVRKMIASNMPVNRKEAFSILPMLTMARGVSNSLSYLDSEDDGTATPKIQTALTDIKTHLDEHPNNQVIVHSHLVQGGTIPMTKALTKAAIKHGSIDGSVKGADRDEAVKRYNAGKDRVIVISSAGATGLNLPRTTMHVALDGHYNPAVTDQIEARGIRASNNNKRVLVRRYKSVMPTTMLNRLGFKKDTTVDQWIYNLAKDKNEVNAQVESLLKSASPKPIQEAWDHYAKVTDKSHGTNHIQGVLQNARQIGKSYPHILMEDIEYAAILHDIAREDDVVNGSDLHHITGKDKALPYLSHLPKDRIQAIQDAIANHRSSSGNPQSDLAKIISDADRVPGNIEDRIFRPYQYRLDKGLPHEEALKTGYWYLKHRLKKKLDGRSLYTPEGVELIKQRASEIDTLAPNPEEYKKLVDKAVREGRINLDKVASIINAYQYAKEGHRPTNILNLAKSTQNKLKSEQELLDRKLFEFKLRAIAKKKLGKNVVTLINPLYFRINKDHGIWSKDSIERKVSDDILRYSTFTLGDSFKKYKDKLTESKVYTLQELEALPKEKKQGLDDYIEGQCWTEYKVTDSGIEKKAALDIHTLTNIAQTVANHASDVIPVVTNGLKQIGTYAGTSLAMHSVSNLGMKYFKSSTQAGAKFKDYMGRLGASHAYQGKSLHPLAMDAMTLAGGPEATIEYVAAKGLGSVAKSVPVSGRSLVDQGKSIVQGTKDHLEDRMHRITQYPIVGGAFTANKDLITKGSPQLKNKWADKIVNKVTSTQENADKWDKGIRSTLRNTGLYGAAGLLGSTVPGVGEAALVNVGRHLAAKTTMGKKFTQNIVMGSYEKSPSKIKNILSDTFISPVTTDLSDIGSMAKKDGIPKDILRDTIHNSI